MTPEISLPPPISLPEPPEIPSPESPEIPLPEPPAIPLPEPPEIPLPEPVESDDDSAGMCELAVAEARLEIPQASLLSKKARRRAAQKARKALMRGR